MRGSRKFCQRAGGGGGGGVQHSDEIFLSVLAGERREDLIPHHRPASEMQ